MNKFFSNEQEVEAFHNDGVDQKIFFGNKKDEIPYQQTITQQPGEMARYIEEEKKEEKKYAQPAKYIDESIPKPVIYEKPTQYNNVNSSNVANQTRTEQIQPERKGFKNLISKMFKK
jgi:hypothetical protein